MNSTNSSYADDLLVRRLGPNEEIPFGLLLLADESREAINKYIYDSEIYVCEKESSVIAVIALMIINEENLEIKNIAVDHAFQNKGTGSFLLNYAFEIAKQRGFKFLLIGTGDHSERQLALYQKAGFARCGIIKDFFILNYPKPIFENGKQLVDMVVLKKTI